MRISAKPAEVKKCKKKLDPRLIRSEESREEMQKSMAGIVSESRKGEGDAASNGAARASVADVGDSGTAGGG